jgi:hypothetical protein
MRAQQGSSGEEGNLSSMRGRSRFDAMKRVPLWLATCSSQLGQTEMNSKVSKARVSSRRRHA